MHSLLLIGTIILTGFLLGEIAKKINAPKIIGYITAGILLNPGLLKLIPADFIKHTETITSISLSIITFSVGGTLHYSRIKRLGKQILYITIFEAEFAFMIIALGFMATTPLWLHLPKGGWLTTFIPFSILIGSLGAPTDPLLPWR